MNMDYCKFENTARDLQQCADAFNEPGLNEYEQRGRDQILRLCREILDNYDPDEAGQPAPTECAICGNDIEPGQDYVDDEDGHRVHATCWENEQPAPTYRACTACGTAVEAGEACKCQTAAEPAAN